MYTAFGTGQQNQDVKGMSERERECKLSFPSDF